jgi:hypothetical protein
MKKGVAESLQVWEVRVAGLPKLLIESISKAGAEAIYKERFHLRSEVTFSEVVHCQPLPNESKQR